MKTQVQRRAGSQTTHSQIWVIGSNHVGRRMLARAIGRFGYKVVEWEDSDELPGPKALGNGSLPAVVFFELTSRKNGRLRAISELTSRVWPNPVVAFSATSDVVSVVDAVRSGAADFLVYPGADAELESAVCRTLSRLTDDKVEDWCSDCDSRDECSMELGRPLQSFLKLRTTGPLEAKALKENFYPFLVASPAMRDIDRIAHQLADSDLTVLIRGDSGSGKEVVARHLHRCSNRRNGPFVKVNCAALPDSLLESELFGYERGAFTGAVSRKIGRFDEAHRGTILLDEISEMSGRLQAKLLHVLQDKGYSRLGGTGSVQVDARVLAATNRDLEQEVVEGRFREDLYFRLKVIDMYVPPLKERREEIPLLVDYFCCRFARQYRRPTPDLSESLLRRLLDHDWPGNVRELENLIKRVVVLGEGSVQEELTRKAAAARRPARGLGSKSTDHLTCGTSAGPLKTAAEGAAVTAERELILRALEQTRWNRRKASDLLGVSYKTIRMRIKKYGLADV